MRKSLLLAAVATASMVQAGGKDAQASSPAKPIGIGTAFVLMNEIEAPIFGDSRIDGTMNLTLVLEAQSDSDATLLRTRMPSLRAEALATTLEFSRLHVSGFLPVNAERLSVELNRALKPQHPGIKKVLIVRLGASPN